MLKHIRLIVSMKELIETMACDMDTKINFSHRNVRNVELGEKKIMIYRILQGALMNIMKHARAKTVDIRMRRLKDKVYLMIKDDGRGFNVHEKKKGGLGLALIRERAKLIKAKLIIKSTVGVGTDIRLIIPVEDLKNG